MSDFDTEPYEMVIQALLHTDWLIMHKPDELEESEIAPRVVALRMILTEDDTLAIEPIGARMEFIEWLTQVYPHVQDEALLREFSWIVAILTSGSQDIVARFMQANFFDGFAKQLEAAHEDSTLEYMVWALGNVAADSPECRDFVLNSFIAEKVIKTVLDLFPTLKSSTQTVFWWFLRNCLGGNPRPALAPTTQITQVLIEAVSAFSVVSMRRAFPQASWSISVEPGSEQDRVEIASESLVEVWWGLGHVSNNDFHAKVMLTRADFVKALFRQLNQSLTPQRSGLLTPMLRVLGNLMSSSDPAAMFAPEYNCFEILFTVLGNPRLKGLHRESLWTLSNILSDYHGLQHVPDHIPELKKVLQTFVNHRDRAILKEACWVAANTLTSTLPDSTKDEVVEILKHAPKRGKAMLEEVARSCSELVPFLPEILSEDPAASQHAEDEVEDEAEEGEEDEDEDWNEAWNGAWDEDWDQCEDAEMPDDFIPGVF